jgi:integrase
MDSKLWKRVDNLLPSALQEAVDQQEKFLRRQCGGNAELMEEVRSLLTSHRKAESFLESPDSTSPTSRRNCLLPAWPRRNHLSSPARLSIKRHLQPAARKLGLPFVNWRCLRTSHATWLVQAEADPKSVQGQMRHSRISTTMDIYAQIVPTAQR